MFGYIRPVRADLLVRDDDLYGALYCGLCRYSGRHLTHFSRFLLNYDFVFLALLRASVTDEEIRTGSVRCPYKLKKKKAAFCDSAFALTAAYFGLFTYYKLLDDLADEKGFKKFRRKLLLPLAKRMRRKAIQLGADEDTVRLPIEELHGLEKENCPSPDKAADCFAKMMAAVSSEGLDGDRKAIASQCGYHIGRFVYLIDALDDLEEDRKNGTYNPFLAQWGQEISEKNLYNARITLEDSMRVFSRTYALKCGPNLEACDRILFNIADRGGPAAVARVLNDKNRKDKRKNR